MAQTWTKPLADTRPDLVELVLVLVEVVEAGPGLVKPAQLWSKSHTELGRSQAQSGTDSIPNLAEHPPRKKCLRAVHMRTDIDVGSEIDTDTDTDTGTDTDTSTNTDIGINTDILIYTEIRVYWCTDTMVYCDIPIY